MALEIDLIASLPSSKTYLGKYFVMKRTGVIWKKSSQLLIMQLNIWWSLTVLFLVFIVICFNTSFLVCINELIQIPNFITIFDYSPKQGGWGDTPPPSTPHHHPCVPLSSSGPPNQSMYNFSVFFLLKCTEKLYRKIIHFCTFFSVYMRSKIISVSQLFPGKLARPWQSKLRHWFWQLTGKFTF